MAEKKESKIKADIEREYTIPLRRVWTKTARYKKSNKAVKEIKIFLARHMKIRDRDLNKIRIDKHLNEMIWSRGIRKPPFKVKVIARKEGDIVRVEASELPGKIRFKKERIERKEQKDVEAISKKKAEESKEEPKEESAKEESKEVSKKKAEETTEKKQEDKKAEEEKKSSVVEAGRELEKSAAKKMKHQTKVSKQPKRQQRKSLAK